MAKSTRRRKAPGAEETEAAKGGEEFVFLPLGGVGEIGMNFALYGYGPPAKREWMIVDVGVTFPGPDLPGVDLVLPDISFVMRERKRIRGIVITHAHEDHYGALLSLWPRIQAPVWMTPFAADMLESKRMGERDNRPPKPDVTTFEAGDRFKVGPFDVEAVHVTHSIPEPVSLAIRTPAGMAVHTGDWKLDPEPGIDRPTDEKRFAELGEEGIDALICDSTNAMREGTSPTEQAVNESLRGLIESAPGRVAIATFSSNVGRMVSVMEAARDANRSVLVMGRSLKRVAEIARERGFFDGLPELLTEDEFGHVPRENVVVLCTGSQGEERAALAKIARDEHPRVALARGDRVIFSARAIPGNEKAILAVRNGLIERGIEIIDDGEHLVHVSGHPRRNELRRMYELTKPKALVPVHGEAAHLVAHAALGEEAGIETVVPARNGTMVLIAPGTPELIGEEQSGRWFKDGNIVGSEAEVGVVDRRRLAFAGHASMSVLLDQRGELVDEPSIVCIGVPKEDDEGDAFEDLLYDAALDAIETMPRSRRKDPERVRDAVASAMRSESREIWGKRPIVTVHVSVIDT